MKTRELVEPLERSGIEVMNLGRAETDSFLTTEYAKWTILI